MPFRSKLIRAETQIAAFLGEAPHRIYSKLELREIFYKARRHDLLARHTTLDDFINFLVQRRHLLSITLKSRQYQDAMTRFCVSPPSPFQLAASLRKNGYLSHGTAAYLHGLIKAPQQAIYINVEQSAKPAVEKSLSQAGIDRAFAGKQRQSQYSFSNEELTVTILAGKNTGRAGVEIIAQPVGEPALATNLERTLVDLAVRPAYAGGISNVLEAYRAARSRTSAEALTLLLDRVGHVYPYAQSIGFLMRQAGYPAEDLGLLRKRITEFKFYLSHDLQDPAYDADWRLFHPWK